MPLTTPNSDVKAVSGAVTMDTVLADGVQYVLRANTDVWYRLSAAAAVQAAAAGADNNHFLPKGATALIAKWGSYDKVSVIKDTGAADGYASLSELVAGA